jgi:hypothetical protein
VRARSLLRLEWDAIAGIIAATLAIVLHLLHLISIEVLITISVVLLALLFLRILRAEQVTERIQTDLHTISGTLAALQSQFKPEDTVLVGPASIASESMHFSQKARGEMVWFHVCLSMFRPQRLFDLLLKPAIVNPNVHAVQFIVDPGQRELWDREVVPKVRACSDSHKVREPVWIPIDESVSIILSDYGTQGATTALLSFWGEPFMARSSGRDVPRYIFIVHAHSELIPRLVDITRDYRLKAPAPTPGGGGFERSEQRPAGHDR